MNTFPLNNGAEIPAIGLGTFRIKGDDCERTVSFALGEGCRLIDTANVYLNERAVGRGIAASRVPREEIFVTSKLWVTEYKYARAKRAIDETLARLGLDHLDLMLLHKPYGDVKGAYHALEDAVAEGKIRMLGVSNFVEEDLEKLLAHCTIRPVLNQIELHPYFQRKELREFMRKEGILAESWFPLGSGDAALFGEEAVLRASEAHARTPAQIILRWHFEEGLLAIPGSKSPTHVRDNLSIFNFSLTEQERADICALDRGAPYFKMKRSTERYACFFQRMNYNHQK